MSIFPWLLLLPIFEFAYIDSGNIDGFFLPENSSEITVGVEAVAYDTLYIKGGSVTYQMHESIDEWRPYLTDYKFEAGIRYKGFEAGYYHECRHRVISGQYFPHMSGGMTKYFIRYGGTL